MKINILCENDGLYYLVYEDGKDVQSFMFSSNEDAINAVRFTKLFLTQAKRSILPKNITKK